MSSSSRFGPVNEVKERLHSQALQRLSGLTEALALSNHYVTYFV
ncbi:hypothetical protein [Bacillus sp. ISL-41]|nr:hypothetical protein [Bacillus sp. ISL-41]